jgi:hypothetical protein
MTKIIIKNENHEVIGSAKSVKSAMSFVEHYACLSLDPEAKPRSVKKDLDSMGFCRIHTDAFSVPFILEVAN